MLWEAIVPILKQESESLETNKITVIHVIPESGLAQEGCSMIQTRVETRQVAYTLQIMALSTSKPWDTSWCNDKKNNELANKDS